MPTSGDVLNLHDILEADRLGCDIASKWMEWDMLRQDKKAAWRELREYIYATDTTTTTNSLLPWKNTTTIPKLTQIRDNLYANYMASMFPNPRWMTWEGANSSDQTREKTEGIKAYMSYVIDNPDFKETISRLVLDYIDYGNCFVMVDWQDDRVDDTVSNKLQHGYVGPVAKRISPLDIVFNPIASSFQNTPKIIRSLVSLGEVKEFLQRMTQNDEEKEAADQLWKYLKEIRDRAGSGAGALQEEDAFFNVDGFGSFQMYLDSNYAEILTFYGDIYDTENDELLKNHVIQVVDRHKVIRKAPNPSYLGRAPIYSVGWRPRQDNLWAMGPLDNLVGMQYRLDHIENLKADLFDLTAFPPLKVRGYVSDFEWQPFEKIVVSEEGDVEVLSSPINPLAANMEIQTIANMMEEMAGAPKEAMGFRTPGEKTAYEVQRLENAASRIFQNKISYFEERILEPLLNGMLELGRRKMDQTTVRVIDDEFKSVAFMELVPEDLTASGRIRPMAARHFIEVADRVQSINAFYSTGVGADPEVRAHISSIEIAKVMEELLDLQNYKLVSPFIRLTEQAEGQQIAMQNEEDTMLGMQTPAGIADDDFDPDMFDA